MNQTKERIEGTKRTANDVKRDSKSVLTPNDTVTVRQKALTNKKQRLESKLLIADDHSLHRADNVVNSPVQQNMCKERSRGTSRDASNGNFDTHQNNEDFNLSGDRFEDLIKVPNLDNENTVCLLLSVKNFLRCSLAHQKAVEDKPASMVHMVN